ncbi:hypothetical protein [Novosphingobium sp.]|uniref:hypothetical protein n=1 Tax=Novosphingobium sp. TaxID=1874826 RepID=UPI003B52BB83
MIKLYRHNFPIIFNAVDRLQAVFTLRESGTVSQARMLGKRVYWAHLQTQFRKNRFDQFGKLVGLTTAMVALRVARRLPETARASGRMQVTTSEVANLYRLCMDYAIDSFSVPI